ncbi:MAG: response regulator [Leptolyngbyaceae cyanobacterium bins.349]|nr:response regulator [Leptolyngbyaceae cyanobacterium bins.349]
MDRLNSKPDSTHDRILVVDDIADNYFLLQTILEEEGYSVDIADNGRLALKKITSDPPDLILLDVMMPEMNGFEVTRHIRQNLALPYIPILLITGYTEPTPGDGYDVGADGFIHKPINFDLLLNRVREILPPRPSFPPVNDGDA